MGANDGRWVNLRKFSSDDLQILSEVKRELIIWECDERVGRCQRFRREEKVSHNH